MKSSSTNYGNQEEMKTSFSDQNSPTKLYQGVRKRKAKWVSEIKDPIKKRRIWLGTYATAEEASKVYESKEIEMEAKVKAAAEKKLRRKNHIIAPTDSSRGEFVDVSERINTQDSGANEFESGSSLKTSNEVVDGSARIVDNSLQVMNGEGSDTESLHYDGKLVVKYGPVIINNYGFILGEFCWLDDLSIN